LRLERVDPLGAYRIPSETGLLIPSENSNSECLAKGILWRKNGPFLVEETGSWPLKKNRSVYQLKVTLRNIRPPIWAAHSAWEDATLAQLHRE
jgi:hypothetical protein